MSTVYIFNDCAKMFEPITDFYAALDSLAQRAEGSEPGSGEQTLVPSPGANIHTCN